MITSFDQLMSNLRQQPGRTIAVAVAEKEPVLEAVRDACAENLCTFKLFGRQAVIADKAAAVDLDLDCIEIVDCADDMQAVNAAVRAVHDESADILMKGHVHTDDFLRAVLDRENGLRTGNIMSHCFVLETTALRGKLTFVTDGAMNIAPDLETKAAIILNAVYLANCFGITCPRVGVLAAVELVNPAMPATLDAAALGTMETRGQFPTCIVDGPFALDNAISPEAARIKGIGGDVAGDCDILVTPDIEAGNILAKAFSFLGGGTTAGVLVGAKSPVVLTSRADCPRARLYSIATAVLMVNMHRTGRMKAGRMHY